MILSAKEEPVQQHHRDVDQSNNAAAFSNAKPLIGFNYDDSAEEQEDNVGQEEEEDVEEEDWSVTILLSSVIIRFAKCGNFPWEFVLELSGIFRIFSGMNKNKLEIIKVEG